MRTLIIDNYDSFTYNLAHLFSEANQHPVEVVYNDAVSWKALSAKSFDNIVISPGPGRPDRIADFGVSRDAILYATVPVLGICLGHQGLACLNGGIISPAPAPVHGSASFIWHDGTGLFESLPNPFKAGRYHSLVAASPLPDPLTVNAWTDDKLIMAIAHKDRPQWGVQFHPESILTEHGDRIARNFRDLTRAQGASFAGWRPAHLPAFGGAAPRPARRAVWRKLQSAPDAETLFSGLYAASTTAFWLDSSRFRPDLPAWSYLGDASGPEGDVHAFGPSGGTERLEQSDNRSPALVFDYLAKRPIRPVDPQPPCPFAGGLVGWFGYELRRETTPGNARTSDMPDALFIQCDHFIAIDHLSGETLLVAIVEPDATDEGEEWIRRTAAKIASLTPVGEPQPLNADKALTFVLDRDHQTYLRDVEQCLDWIRQGETYQICLTNQIRCKTDVDPFTLYRFMRQINPAPYGAYLRWPGGAVLSCSPERFLSARPSGDVETKPIKGTIRRDADPEVDRLLSRRLNASDKDRAENVMIVDLLRNDLSRVCEPGSVIVPKLCDIESYATVHQMVSTVRGKLSPGKTSLDLIRAAFPGGSMTGAPKVRSLTLIDALEQSPRGVYAGALGWLGDNDSCELSIVIRTIVAMDGCLTLGVGGGVVAASTPEGEYEEMLLKAKASVRAIAIATLGPLGEELYTLVGAEPTVSGEVEVDAVSIKARVGAPHAAA